MNRGPWSPEETAVLIEMTNRGCTAAQIAVEINRSRKSVSERKHRLGLSAAASRPWTRAEEDRLVEMIAAGKSKKEIGEALGRTPAACAQKRLAMNLPVCAYWTGEEDDRLEELAEAGKSRREIAAIMGRSESAIRQRCNMLDIKKPRTEQDRRKEREEPAEPKGTLCWRCNKACTRGCSWAARFEPVSGWDATPNGKSYQVNACPEFEPDKKWRPQ